jgi:predicted Ser/Thr protein kinase
MNHPTKHILIKKGEASRKTVVMIDFERCKQTENPKNVTQFCQYILKYQKKINKKKLMRLLQEYKKDYSSLSFRRLLNLLFN